jgi:hypothetical protein
MLWLYPSFLWALLALSIPIIIHLFNFRRYKKFVFPNVRLLTQINQQTKSGNQLKRYLILLSRLLALTFLIFAFAQPILLDKNKELLNGKNSISIILDNSYSMNLPSEEGLLLEAAKNRARAIVNAAGNDDEFNIVTSDIHPEFLHFVNKQSALENIDKIKITTASSKLQKLLDVQDRTLKERSGNRLAYCISDFQEKSFNAETSNKDTSILKTWIKLNASENSNFSIDTCYLESPVLQAGQSINLIVQVSNYTENPVEALTVELIVDDKPKGIASFNIPAFSNKKQIINFSLEQGGNHSCKLKLPGDNIPLDDELFFSMKLNQNRSILNISETGEKFVESVFKDNPGFIYKKNESGSVNYSQFKSADLIVLQGVKNIQSGMASEIKSFVKNGGTCFVFPNSEDESKGGLSALSNEFGFGIETGNTVGQLKVSQIELEHPIFSQIFEKKPNKPDLPIVSKYLKYQINGGAGIMKLANGNSFLHDIGFGKGHLILCASALNKEWSNFQNHALFLPILVKSSMLGNYKTELYHSCGNTESISTGLPFLTEKNIQLRQGEIVQIPEVINSEGEMFLNTNGEIEVPGQYDLMSSDTLLNYLSFNLDRTESDPRSVSEEKYQLTINELGIKSFEGSSEKLYSEFNKAQKGTELWKWCIIFALIFLFLEIILIRFFKNNAKLPA